MWCRVLLVVLMSLVSASAFVPLRSGLVKSRATQRVAGAPTNPPRRLLKMVVQMPEEIEVQRPFISIAEFFTPPFIDKTNVLFTLFGQGLLLVISLMGESLLCAPPAPLHASTVTVAACEISRQPRSSSD